MACLQKDSISLQRNWILIIFVSLHTSFDLAPSVDTYPSGLLACVSTQLRPEYWCLAIRYEVESEVLMSLMFTPTALRELMHAHNALF